MLNAYNNIKIDPNEYLKLGSLFKLWCTTNNKGYKQLVAHLESNYKGVGFKFPTDIDTTEKKAEFLTNIKNGRNTLSSRAGVEDNDALIWRKILTDFEDQYIEDVNDFIYGSFYERTFGGKSHFNWQSILDLINSLTQFESVIYFNTFIGGQEWFAPLIQMHIAIQKSIEQKINYSHIEGCHNDLKTNTNSKSNPFVKKCFANPPIYRQYRVMFYPKTTKDLKALYNKKDREYNTLTFVSNIHTSMSMQLAFFTLDDWFQLIKENSNFFNNSQNLIYLGLNSEEINSDLAKLSKDRLFSHIASCLYNQRHMPDEKQPNGIDFLYGNSSIWDTSKNKLELNGEMYSTYYEKAIFPEGGVKYYKIEDSNVISTKNEFSNLIIKYLLKVASADSSNSYKQLDPIHNFYLLHQKQFYKFKDGNDASILLNLNSI